MNQIDQNMIEDTSLGLILQDGNERISWANQAMAEMLGVNAGALAGKRPYDLPASAQRLLGTEPKLVHDLARQRWLRRESRRNEGGERLFLFADVTEQQLLAEENARLRQQVEDLKLTDELTGLANKRAISQALDLHVSRSRRYHNPLSVVLVYVDAQPAAGVKPLSSDPVILSVSRFLRDRLRWVDQIGRWEENLFLLVLPETTDEDARGLLDKIHAEQAGMTLPEAYRDLPPQLTFGLARWQKGDDMRTLLRKAVNALQESSGA